MTKIDNYFDYFFRARGKKNLKKNKRDSLKKTDSLPYVDA